MNSKMPRDMSGKEDIDQGGGTFDPNGGGTRGFDVPKSKMPAKQKTAPHQGADLNCPTSKMPRSQSGGRQRDPHLK